MELHQTTDRRPRPNVFLVGAAKSGTTSLANCLDGHPQVFMSRPKEPNYFALPPDQPPSCCGPIDSEQLAAKLLAHAVTDLSEYERLFSNATRESVRCDASVRYLYELRAPARICEYAADAKVIAILRDPVERLHSHYHMNVCMGIEPESFERAIELEDDRVADGWGWDWHYVRVSCYARQLRRYFDRFPRQQVLVVFFEDFCRDSNSVLREVFEFLGVSPHADATDSAPSNVGQTPRFRSLRRLLWDDNMVKSLAQHVMPKSTRRTIATWLESVNRRSVPNVDLRLRRQLQERLADDRRELETLLQRSVPW